MMTNAEAISFIKQAKDFILTVRLADAIDIAVISTFIYLLIVWFERARAKFMLAGMIMVGLIYAAARFFGMYLTTLFFQAFFAISLIMIVVIFQDDFRQFFERVALWGVSQRRRLKEKTSFGKEIDIITSGVANISRKRIGALIVIRGVDPLDRHIEAGVRIDGLLSDILLESIFDPHAPSHDGAVILDGMRMTRFGCHLPLSVNVEEIGHLGTRHAAALGMAERSDAICVVVSEQRGTISVAEDRRIRQLSDITELDDILKDFFLRRFPDKKKSALDNFLKGHLPEKGIAFVLACALWAAFSYRIEMVRRDFVVPVEYRNLAVDRIVEEPTEKEICVTLSGSERSFNLMSIQDLKVSLDMSGAKDGKNVFSLTKDMIKNPAGLSVVNIEPSEIRLGVHTMVRIYIPVDLQTIGETPRGITLLDIKVEPAEVPVLVPSSVRKETIYIATEPVDLREVTATRTFAQKLVISPESIDLPDDGQSSVNVTVTVEKTGI
jgi:uncharacterized protein (TIGR00159 family)